MGMSKSRQVDLIHKIQRVREIQDSIGSEENLSMFSFPQIVAIGSQSSGKSSVLESIVGVEFLPRDRDMCTRCPLILNLKHDKLIRKGEFKFADSDTIYTAPQEVTAKINETTERIAEGYKTVSQIEIKLTYTSHDVIDLQLVDLPGFIMNTVENQPEAVKEDINRLAKRYIDNKDVLILAVQSATSDHIQNSVALAMAKEADPEKRRTIGVLTKMDLLNNERDHIDPIISLLKNEDMPLARGYFPVVNKSAEEFASNTPMQEVRDRERQVLQNLLKHNYNSQCGIENLGAYLFNEFAKAIDMKLPDVIQQGRVTLEDIEYRLQALGFEEDDTMKTAVVMGLVQRYCEMVNAALGGNKIDARDDVYDTGHLFRNKLKESVTRACIEATDFDQAEIKRKMQIAIGNLNASYDAFILNERIFHKFVHDLTDRFRAPLTKVIDEMTTYLVNSIRKKVTEVLCERPYLENAVWLVVSKKIEEIRKMCRDDMIKHIDIHKNLVNIQHPDFVEIKDRLDGNPQPQGEQNPFTRRRLSTASATSQTSAASSGAAATGAAAAGAEEGGSIAIPTQIDRQPDFALQMILKYMNIVDKILKDYALKSIHYHLMRQVIDFHLFYNLWKQIGNPGHESNMRLASPDENTQRNIEMLRDRREHIRQVLQLLEA